MTQVASRRPTWRDIEVMDECDGRGVRQRKKILAIFKAQRERAAAGDAKAQYDLLRAAWSQSAKTRAQNRKRRDAAPAPTPKKHMRVVRADPRTGKRVELDLPITKEQIDAATKAEVTGRRMADIFYLLKPWQLDFYLYGSLPGD